MTLILILILINVYEVYEVYGYELKGILKVNKI